LVREKKKKFYPQIQGVTATTWYSSPRSTTTTTVVGSLGGGELDDDIPLWR
jgi:hypothetical protein